MSASTTVVSILSLRARSSLSPASFASSAWLSCSIAWGPARRTSSGQGGRVRDGLVQADVAEPPPGDRVGDLAAQALVAELVAVFEVQQSQQGLHRERGAAQPGRKQCPPRRNEAFVVEVGVDAGELVGQTSDFGWEQRVPGGRRRSGNTKHHKLLERSEGANSSFCRVATTLWQHFPCSQATFDPSSSAGSS